MTLRGKSADYARNPALSTVRQHTGEEHVALKQSSTRKDVVPLTGLPSDFTIRPDRKSFSPNAKLLTAESSCEVKPW